MNKQNTAAAANTNEDIIREPPGCMNVKLWYDHLTPAMQQAYQRGKEMELARLEAESQAASVHEMSRRGSVSGLQENEQFADCQ